LNVSDTFSFQDVLDGKVSFIPTLDFNGPVAIDYTVNDLEPLSASATVSLDITPVNDAPMAVNGGSMFNEDTIHVMTTSDFNITDVDNIPAELTITLDSVPQEGSLYLNGTTVLNVSDTFSFQDVLDDKVSFIP